MKENLKNILRYTKINGSGYQGKKFDTGYHTLEIDGEIFQGQRNPKERLLNVPYDFNNKTVLDIGSNQGGMLFSIKDKISKGIGVDYDYRLVNSANALSNYYSSNQIQFYVHNLDQDPLTLLEDYNESKKYDIVFLLSVCMWIKSWKELILWVSKNSTHCLFETNGDKKQQAEQLTEIKKYYKNVDLINEKSLDDPKQHNRKLFLCY